MFSKLNLDSQSENNGKNNFLNIFKENIGHLEELRIKYVEVLKETNVAKNELEVN